MGDDVHESHQPGEGTLEMVPSEIVQPICAHQILHVRCLC